MTRLLTAAVLFGAAVGVPEIVAGDDAPTIPKEIAVPAGHTQVLAFEAKGVQIYKSGMDKDGKLVWLLEAPLAELTNDKGKRVGSHFGDPKLGVPAWEMTDGSRLVRDKAVDVKFAPAKNPADIPWLLVRVKSDDGKPGTLAKVDYVQRVSTEGGKPPAEAPSRTDTRIGVPYKATYVFFAPTK